MQHSLVACLEQLRDFILPAEEDLLNYKQLCQISKEDRTAAVR